MADWKQLADDSYSAASMLLAAGRWRSAVSRAYYAAYSLLTAELVLSGVDMPKKYEGPSHSRLPELILNNLKSLKDDRWIIWSLVKGLYNLRLIADYRPSEPLENAEARESSDLMVRVFQCLKKNKER